MVEQHSTTNENESLPKITLSTPIDELKVLCEFIMDFDGFKLNGFDLTGYVVTQLGTFL